MDYRFEGWELGQLSLLYREHHIYVANVSINFMHSLPGYNDGEFGSSVSVQVRFKASPELTYEEIEKLAVGAAKDLLQHAVRSISGE